MISDGYKKWIKKVEGKKDVPFETPTVTYNSSYSIYNRYNTAAMTDWSHTFPPGYLE